MRGEKDGEGERRRTEDRERGLVGGREGEVKDNNLMKSKMRIKTMKLILLLG